MSSSAPAQGAALADWLVYLETLHPKAIDLGLDRIRAVAGRLGLSLDCVKITVAGTNGKGSTCAMLEAMLLTAGYKVGKYASPHLLRFNERIRVNGEEASDTDIVAQFERIEDARDGITLTYFEMTTLAALLMFQAARLDVVVLEVGLGRPWNVRSLAGRELYPIARHSPGRSPHASTPRRRPGRTPVQATAVKVVSPAGRLQALWLDTGASRVTAAYAASPHGFRAV